jgi:cytochrome c-type biogenesis protein CcsB
MAIVILLLMAATVVEQLCGTDAAHSYLYASPLSIALWAALVVAAMAWLCAVRSRVGLSTLLIHVALAVILAGALTSHLTARQGSLHLRVGDDPTYIYRCGAAESELPFGLSLRDFHLQYYAATSAPMDFVSSLQLTDGTSATVSMNRVLSHSGYRFYQSAYDADMQGSILMVAYDPYGIAVTYTGYALLLVAMISFLLQKRSGWRLALAKAATRRTALTVACLMASASLWPVSASASAGTPKTVSSDVADAMGDIYIYYNDRACPLETFARDFTTKVYGNTEYRGLSAVQVLAGWLFYYDDWKSEPFIKIKEKSVRRVLGADGSYCALSRFVSPKGYKLDDTAADVDAKAAASANEKFGLVSTVATGAALHIYPVASADGTSVTWYSPVDKLPADTPEEEWIFIRKSLNLLAQYIYEGNSKDAVELLHSVKRYQQKSAGTDALPGSARFKAEKVYNRMPATRYVGMGVLLLGIISYALLLVAMIDGRGGDVRMRCVQRGLFVILIAIFLLLTVEIALRWMVSGHLPLTNGFETMQFMAWCCALLALVLSCQWGGVALSAGLTVCGFALLVAGLGERNPQITQLMPVLASPLLSLHVVVIMLSYSLLAVCALNGIAAMIINAVRGSASESIDTLHTVSRVLLTPAIFLLAAGIFIGAVWANCSWGTYWSWDPKETWALITLMLYAFALHDVSIPAFRRPMIFHIYMTLAFLAVLMTYFGVNYLLGGMHSYAN